MGHYRVPWNMWSMRGVILGLMALALPCVVTALGAGRLMAQGHVLAQSPAGPGSALRHLLPIGATLGAGSQIAPLRDGPRLAGAPMPRPMP
jgi:hypothetical protein